MKNNSRSPKFAIGVCVIIAGILLLVTLNTNFFGANARQASTKKDSSISEQDIYKVKDLFVQLRENGKSDITAVERQDSDTAVRYLVTFGRILETYQIQDKVVKLNESTVVLEVNRKTSQGQIYFKVNKNARSEVAEASFSTLMQILAEGAAVDWISVYRTQLPEAVPDDFAYHPIGQLLASVFPSAGIMNDGHERSIRLFQQAK